MKIYGKSEVASGPMNDPAVQLRFVPRKHSSAPSLDEGPLTDPLFTVGLFAGIGGIEAGFARSGHETRLLCEIDRAANEVLDAHFEHSIRRVTDVCALASLPSRTELVAAGFPCQDLSQAGRTAGITGSRSGLVAEIFRLLEGRKVEWVLLENVPFMLQLGGGQALNFIVSQLERLGYRWAYRIVNSKAFGLPQRRERVYLLASRRHDPRAVLYVDAVPEPVDSRSFREVPCGFYWTEGLRGLGWAIDSVPTLKGGSTIGIPSPPAIIFPSGRIAKPDIRDAERLQGFDEDWTKPAENVVKAGARWKLVGNAVTVDAASWIGARLRRQGEYDEAGDVELKPGPWPRAAYNIGRGRFVAHVSAWPIAIKVDGLSSFFRHPLQDLSEKATLGFLSRARQAKLRFPNGFVDAIEAHLSRVRAVKVQAAV